MAWQKIIDEDREGGNDRIYWFNTETGQRSETEPPADKPYLLTDASSGDVRQSFSAYPSEDAEFQEVWRNAPGSTPLEKYENIRASTGGGALELADKAMRLGLLSPQELQSHPRFLDILQQNQDRGRFTRFGGEVFLPALMALMGYGAGSAAFGAEGATAGTTAGTTGGIEAALASGAPIGGAGAGGATLGAGSGAAASGGAAALGGAAGGTLGALAQGAGGAAGGALVDGVMTDGATSGTIEGVSGGAAGAAAGTALSRILANDGTATAADYLSILGTIGTTGLGVFGANRQANALEDLANKYMEFGAPSRARFESSFAPGFTMANDPGFTDALDQTAKSTLHGMSAKFGNPSDSPNAWAATLNDLYKGTAYPALQDYRRLNANTGGLSRFAEAAPGVATGAIGADAGKLNAIGYGAANIFNPPSTLEQLLRGMRAYG